MTQITATLEKGTDPNVIRKILENIKGVHPASISIKNVEVETKSYNKNEMISEENKEWLEKLNKLYHNVDRAAIDLNDERTKYILSK